MADSSKASLEGTASGSGEVVADDAMGFALNIVAGCRTQYRLLAERGLEELLPGGCRKAATPIDVHLGIRFAEVDAGMRFLESMLDAGTGERALSQAALQTLIPESRRLGAMLNDLVVRTTTLLVPTEHAGTSSDESIVGSPGGCPDISLLSQPHSPDVHGSEMNRAIGAPGSHAPYVERLDQRLLAEVTREHDGAVLDDVRRLLSGDSGAMRTRPVERDEDGFVINPNLSYAALIARLATTYIRRSSPDEGNADLP